MQTRLSEPLPDTFHESYGAPHATIRGEASGTIFSPDGYSLWRIVGDLSAGTSLVWGTEHGDEALFVLSGHLDYDGVPVHPETALIVEAGVAAELRAIEDSRVVHFGPHSIESPDQGPWGSPREIDRRVHIVGPSDAEHFAPRGEKGPQMLFYSDGTCPTCRIGFFMVDYAAEGYTGASHTHSEDEIIHVLDGTLQVGPMRVETGMSIAVPKDVRYGLRSADPFRMLNYRRDVSTYAGPPGTEPYLEVLANLRVNALPSR
jgi:quercetin dioxygenase-like cupin family protein